MKTINISKKFKGLLWFCIIALILLSGYLVFSNRIIQHFSESDFFQRESASIETYQKDSIIMAVDTFGSRGDFMETVSMSGWAFVPTLENNDKKVIGCILSDEENVYVFETNMLVERRDLGTSNEMRGVRHGFNFQISTVGISAGNYDIYVYCRENDTNYGIVFSGYQLKKWRGVEILPWQSHIVEDQSDGALQDATIAADYCELQTDGSLLISGWAVLDGIETEGQTVYVKILKADGSSTVYTALRQIRRDLGAGNALYDHAGFKALIPPGAVTTKDEIADMAVYIVNEDGWHTSEQVHGPWR